MNEEVFLEYIKGALDNIRYNVSRVTDRHCDSEDSSEHYVEAITPLLKHQMDLIKLLKE